MTRRQTVADIMQREVATLDAGDRLDLADDIMRLGRVRHMPVLEDGRAVGVVSNRDLLAASLSKALEFDDSQRRTFMRSIEVREVMTADLVTVEPETPLRAAAATLLQKQIGCLVVVGDDDVLVGLVTETDLLRAAFLRDEEDEEPARTLDVEAKQGGTPMTDLGDRLREEFDDLKRMRDELRVRVHLGKAEAKELWEKLEHKFGEVEGKVKLVSRESREPLEEVGEAARLLVGEIRDGYKRIRDAL